MAIAFNFYGKCNDASVIVHFTFSRIKCTCSIVSWLIALHLALVQNPIVKYFLTITWGLALSTISIYKTLYTVLWVESLDQWIVCATSELKDEKWCIPFEQWCCKAWSICVKSPLKWIKTFIFQLLDIIYTISLFPIVILKRIFTSLVEHLLMSFRVFSPWNCCHEAYAYR